MGTEKNKKYSDLKHEDFLTNSACGTECTGLISRPAQNEEERKSYEQVYRYLPPTSEIARKTRNESRN